MAIGASAATTSVPGVRLAVSPDGKFFRPAGVERRGLVLVEPGVGGIEAAAGAGADGVVGRWPLPEGLARASRAAGLIVAAEVGAGQRRARLEGVDLVIAPGRGEARALRAGGLLIAGPVEDPRSGRCAGQAAFGRADPGAEAEQVLGLQLDARRRPVVVEVSSFEGAVTALDLGSAAVVVRGEGIDVARRLAEFERSRLAAAPLVSVVVCAFNAEHYISACLRSLRELRYPRYEVLVIDDGSTDRTPALAREQGGENVRVIELDHAGLSAARNVGAREALGEWVAYLDADAEAHRDWLAWAWRGLDRLAADGISGPNYPFEDAGFQERVVSGAPGAPVPAVNPDGTAEHLPGCNMILRRQLVLDIGFREGTTTGEDVLFCAQALERGARLVYHPTAAIDHHRRASLPGYLRQQRSYGALMNLAPGAHAINAPPSPTPWLSRLNPLKRRYVFSGAQEAQLYAHRAYPVNTTFPLKLLGAAAAAAAASLLPALALGHGRRWLAVTAGSLTAIIAWMAALVPAFRPPPGPVGLLQRVATAALWLAKPIAHAAGRRNRG